MRTKKKRWRPGRSRATAALVVACVGVAAWAEEISEAALARRLLDKSGVHGGLLVHVGCGDGRLTAALAANGRFVVHGLARDREEVARAREHVRSAGLAGKVFVERWVGQRLPYTDNLVNLLVAEDGAQVRMAHVRRVLAPQGAACVKSGGEWGRTAKPQPEGLDEWTHFLHDPSGNAVAQDAVVGPPRHMQWVAAPRWARSHEHLASVSACVTADGRLFYIADYGPAASVTLPSNWTLVARDAFSGVQLWSQPVGEWAVQLRGFRSGPADLPRRLVAHGDRVYVTLGYGEPLTALDAATGETLRTYEGTEGAHEVILQDGVLFLVIGQRDAEKAAAARRRGAPVPPLRQKRLQAINAATGEVLWTKADQDTHTILPLTLAVADGRLYVHNTACLLCLDARSGEERWRVARAVAHKRPAWSAPTLVVAGDVVLCADRADGKAPSGGEPPPVDWVVSIAGGGRGGELTAYAAATGKKLWSRPCHETYNAPPDVFVVGDQVWTGQLRRSRDPGFTRVYDVATGEVAREFAVDPDFRRVGMPHHRCHRNKATQRFILTSKAGVEFVEVTTGTVHLHNWVRGSCQYGVLPANGLLYAPPHSCACFIKAKLNGFNALAPERQAPPRESPERLERGPAYGDAAERTEPAPGGQQWPTYRHDPARSGATPAAVPAEVEPVWRTKLDGSLTAPTIAGGKVYLASVATHTVHALDAESGRRLWSFVAGGRVDSPPTIDSERVLFGSADGHVYCLRARDGELAWRFRAAPEDRRVVAYEQVESAWPVHGSVLVRDGSVYVAAGRSSFLDDGIHLWRLDAATGREQYHTVVCDLDPKTGEQPPVRGFEMEGALPDVLSSDGESVFMRHRRFDAQCVEREEPATHLFSPTGFLDGSWWHRSYWMYGERFQAGWGGWWRAGNRRPAGRLLVFDAESIYGFGRSFYPSGNAGQWNQGESYRFYATSKALETVPPPEGKDRRRRTSRSIVKCRWSHEADFAARAMVLAGDILFAAGPVGDTARDLEAFRGSKGIVLRALATRDGRRLAQRSLDALPVFDGMAAAAGRLYLATAEGTLVCFGKP
ncbi:MAG: PQQ-binding-like beta-propeller repeat protein [bacterium]